MAFKAAGSPCALYREQLLLNGASYDYVSAGGGVTSDDYELNANVSGMPARQSHLGDVTAYTAAGTKTTGSDWDRRIANDFSSPARVGTAGWQNLAPGTP